MESASSLQLAMAAFVGASLMAVSAFYIHKRSVDQILQRLIEIRKLPPNARKRSKLIYSEDEEGEEVYGEDDEEEEVEVDVGSDSEISRRLRNQRFSRSLDNHCGFRNNMSSSLPNVALGNQWMNDEMHELDQPIRFSQSSSSFSNLHSIPLGLPPLQTVQRDGMDSPFVLLCIG